MGVRSWTEYQRGLLLEGRWLPVTGCVLFVKASVQRCVDKLTTGGRARVVMEVYGHPQRVRPVRASNLEDFLRMLLPLDAPVNRRYLFLPTANPKWTAMFTSDWRGQGQNSAMAWFASDGIESVCVFDIPNNYDSKTNRGFYGERKIGMYELTPNGQSVWHSLGVQMHDSSRWELVLPSRPFPVGNIWDPLVKRIPDRFTHEHLVEMTSLFGLRPFDEDFYAPDGQGIIVERTNPMQPDERTFTLAQARGEEPVVW